MRKLLFASLLLGAVAVNAQDIKNNPGSNHGNRFEQLGTILPTPNEYRTASGAPGPKYWQQRADYDIKCELDEQALRLKGVETVTYYNNSPDPLDYIWLQVDENEHSNINNAGYQDASRMGRSTTTAAIDQMLNKEDNGYGDKITRLVDATGKALKYTVNKTMMRIDLPTQLKPGQKFVFTLEWYYNISDRLAFGGRGGYEFFPEDGNHFFTMAQWYPRLCVYSDFQGWQNHQFTGRGEFALTFGNFNVQMTVPADHVILGTGQCTNYPAVLSPAQLTRWNQAQTSKEPVEVVTLAEATAAEKSKSTKKKTWIFKAENVRDFAWTSSRKIIWDAMPAYVDGKKVMCMSGYPKEAYGLYRKFSTKVVAHTIKTYSKFSIPYPYPVAQSIEASNGMEYPMICFNNGRTAKDGTYSESTKFSMLGVIIHEVGHNFFPMIVNSDERQWTWMDEGLNSFVEYLTEELYDSKYPSRSMGAGYTIARYMGLPKDQLEPIMTNSENIAQFGPNAYSKPATGLNILRETIMGRELFDYSFKEYAKRWAFKHPTPADLFRTMEDASGEDLDWFWRGWFYSTDACDISLDSVRHAVYDPTATAQAGGGFPGGRPGGFNGGGNNSQGTPMQRPQVSTFEDISKMRNKADKNIVFATDADTSLRDFYWRYDRGIEPYDSITKNPPMTFTAPTPEPMTDGDKAKYANVHMYELSLSNKGGLTMPIIVEFTFEDGTKEIERVPAQIWRHNEHNTTKVFVTRKRATGIKLDPYGETADINTQNNTWPKAGASDEPSKFSIFKASGRGARGAAPAGLNPMQNAMQKAGK